MAVEKIGRIRTFVNGLDERMEGGIPEKSIVLVCGRAGTMKSSLTYNILYHNALSAGKKGLYITLEQSRESIMEHMRKIGFVKEGQTLQVKDLEDLVIIDMAKLRKETADKLKIEEVNWLNSLVTLIRNYKKVFGCELLVVDSLSALYSLSNFRNPRSELFVFFEQLRDIGLTTFLISEIIQQPDKQTFGIHGVEDFLADGIFHLETERDGRKVNLFLSAVKMRKTNHDRSYYPLIVDENGFEIVTD